MQKKQENYITTAELAKMLGISRVAAAKRVTKLIKEGRISATEKGKGYIIKEDSLPDEIKNEIRKQQEESAKKITELSLLARLPVRCAQTGDAPFEEEDEKVVR